MSVTTTILPKQFDINGEYYEGTLFSLRCTDDECNRQLAPHFAVHCPKCGSLLGMSRWLHGNATGERISFYACTTCFAAAQRAPSKLARACNTPRNCDCNSAVSVVAAMNNGGKSSRACCRGYEKAEQSPFFFGGNWNLALIRRVPGATAALSSSVADGGYLAAEIGDRLHITT